MELRDWIMAEHDSVLTRFERSIVGVVAEARWREQVGAGGSSIAFLLFHTTYHEDLAVNAVLAGGEPVMAASRGGLGIGALPLHAGLGETEPPELTAALDVGALVEYSRDVHDATTAWLTSGGVDALDAVPDSSGGLERAGVTADAVPWLHKMWAGQPASFFVQWEAIGHRINHVGEMVSVRNRMGLSPF